MVSIQIQTIMYKNEKESILRSLESIKQALIVANIDTKKFDTVRVCYGDASPSCIFSKKEIEALDKKYKETFSITYTYFNCNTGTSKGHNLLAKNSNVDYLILMNPDIIFSPRFLIEVMEPFNDKDVGIVEGRQVPIEHPKEYSIETGETSWSSGACTVIKTGLFDQVNGYDEKSFFMYCDDVDLSWRIRLLGKKVIYQPRATVFHAKRLSNKGHWQATPAEIYYSAEASLLMAYKWSNKKLLSELLSKFKVSKNKNLKKAVSNFEMRKEKGLLPKQLDKKHTVAQFIDGNYTKHRFLL